MALKIYKVQIPLAGIYTFNGLLEEGLTDEEVINQLVESYNATSRKSKAYKSLVVGQEVQFPLTRAKVERG